MPRAKVVQFVDFFAGAGGMTSAFLATRTSGYRFECLGALDIDEVALETLALNTGAPVFPRDIREVAAQPNLLVDLIPDLGERKHPLVFVGCPPCQGFSAHRKKDDRDDPRNSLIGEFARLVAYFKPNAVVMENVPEMLNGRYEDYFKQARETLQSAGYHIDSAVLDMSRFGVPQRRRRALVTASTRPGLRLPAPPLGEHEVVTVREAIGHLPAIASGETNADDPWHAAPNHTVRIVEKIRKIPPDGGDRRNLSGDDQLACHVDVDEGSTPGFTDVYGRLRWDAPAVTITAKSSTPSCGRFIHPENHRNISVREAALLQGFPHNYVFAGGLVHQYRQIGEAVPPKFARFMAFQVLTHLDKRNSSPVRIKRVIERATIDAKQQSPSAPLSVDLFCGAGGLSLGLAAAGLSSCLAVDADMDSVATFSKNIGHAVEADVNDADFARQLDEATAGLPYVLVGGPPCQGFSQQRRGPNTDERNDLVLRFGEVALEANVRPRAIVLENVSYLDSPRGSHILKAYVEMLELNDYVIHRYNVNSANFGVAQTRPRILVFAVQRSFVEKFKGLQSLSAGRWLSVGEALWGLDSTPGDLPNHVIANESELNKRRMAFVDMGRGRTAIPPAFQLRCHTTYDGHLDVFGRLDWFGQARTITGGFDSASRGEYGHPFRNRSLTAREAARIQGFPDDFAFVGNKASVRRQIGNAVPPPLGLAIGRSLLPLMG